MERWQKPEAENARADPADDRSRSSLDYNTPLRSTRGDATTTPSSFYKLSSELSRESLRTPGTVPFMWEQSPGRRKFMAPSTISPPTMFMHPPACSFNITTSAADPLFQQPCFKGDVEGMPATSNSSPATRIRPRSSIACFSVIPQRDMPQGRSFNHAALSGNSDDDDGVSEEGISDVFTATAGEGLSVDDSMMRSGAFRPASTPSEARDFIMHRFLPAAHTIACESPQTPSRRFLLPVGVAPVPASPATTARSTGSFQDHASACTAVSRPSPLRYASSASSMPSSNALPVQPRGQLCAGSFCGEEEEEREEEEEEEEDEEPPFRPKVCGIFPFHINFSFHSRNAARACPSSKHQHGKQQHQQQQKKSSKLMNLAGIRMRIMYILRDDHSSTHDDESSGCRFRSKQSKAERQCTKMAVLERAGLLYVSNNPCIKPPFDAYKKARPRRSLRQLFTAQHELYNEEASEYSSFQDAPSRFTSPSPAALHLYGRASRSYNSMQSPLVNTSAAHRSRSFAGFQDDHEPAEQHPINGSFYYHNMHTSISKPHHHFQLASPSTYHTPLSSHVSASDQCNADQWHAHSPSSHFAQKANIINNDLYDPEDQDFNMIHMSKGDHYVIIGDQHHGIRGDQCVSKQDQCVRKGGYSVSNDDHHMEAGDYRQTSGNHYVIDGDLQGDKGDHHVSNGSHYMGNGSGDNHASKSHHYARKDDAHDVSNDNNHVINGDNHVSNDNNHVSNGDMYVNIGDLHARIDSSYVSKSLLSPPLPKSPTHSWLDRAMPLVASTNKSVGVASRFSPMHKARTTPAEDPVFMSKMGKQGHPLSAEAPKWEALVKGSHLQPGHLRFSEELYHQSRNIMKVVAS